jgi:hypothetical protein
MIEISATATAPVFPMNAFCLSLVDRNGLHPKDPSNVLDSEVIGIENCIEIESKRKKVAIRIRDYTRISGFFGCNCHVLSTPGTRRNNVQTFSGKCLEFPF